MYDIKMLKAKKLAELIEIAEEIGIKDLKGLKKQDIIDQIVGSKDENKSQNISDSKIANNNFKDKRPNNGSNKIHHKIF